MFYGYDTQFGEIFISAENGYITGISTIKPVCGEQKENSLTSKAFSQIKEYFAGKRKSFDLPIKLEGTDFQKKVWQELLKIPYGKTISYKQLAKNTGNEKACRAVGMANNKNKIMIVIPCHRVIGSNGNLTGYAGGLELKKFLLDLEQS